MRDAFGGVFTIQVILVFIFIYVGFLGLAINYGKSFKLKNNIIDYLEENQISSLDVMTAVEQDDLETAIDEATSDMNYNSSGICDKITDTATRKCHKGVVIEQVSSVSKHGVTYVQYKVTTYINYSFGFLNSLLSLGGTSSSEKAPIGFWAIAGEAKVTVIG